MLRRLRLISKARTENEEVSHPLCDQFLDRVLGTGPQEIMLKHPMDFEWIDVWFNTRNLKKARRVDLREPSLMKELPNFPEAGAS